jgi:hypothetical protein
MPTNTPDQQITIPQGTDLADVVNMVANMIADMETRLNLRYADAADRGVRHPVGTEGEDSDLAAEGWADSFDGVRWISRTARGYRGYKVRTADAPPVNNSIALVSDATLVVPIEATGTFIWGFDVFYDAAAAADLRLAFTWPGAPAPARWGGVGRAPGTSTNIDTPVTTLSGTALQFGSIAVGTQSLVTGSGIIVNTGAAGNLQMQYAQAVADPSNLTVRSGSRLWALKVTP